MPYQAKVEVSRHGLKIDGVPIIRISQLPHPGDEYLHVVLAENPSKLATEYVTWLYNSECGGFFYGNYHKHFSEALKDFNRRVTEYDEKYSKAVEVDYAPRKAREAHYNATKVENIEDHR